MPESKGEQTDLGLSNLFGSALGENVCMSGGATGADAEFGMVAEKNGHTVIHWSFSGHNTTARTVPLTDDLLKEADPYLRKAKKRLKRRFPPKSKYVADLLRRNYFQVRWTEKVYAIADFEADLVSGGTAWAVQMFLDRHQGKECPCYVFSQLEKQWYVWQGRWTAIASPPIPEGIYTGIGSRKITDAGIAAIHQLYG